VKIILCFCLFLIKPLLAPKTRFACHDAALDISKFTLKLNKTKVSENEEGTCMENAQIDIKER
jgi:hypothetical protein